jgi:hypothetical protein
LALPLPRTFEAMETLEDLEAEDMNALGLRIEKCVDEGKLLFFTTEWVVNRVHRMGSRLVAESKGRRERKRKETAEPAEAVETADADVFNDGNEDASDLILQRQTFSEPLMYS